MRKTPKKPTRRRNPYAAALVRLRRQVKPSAKVYSRKGRPKSRPELFRASA